MGSFMGPFPCGFAGSFPGGFVGSLADIFPGCCYKVGFLDCWHFCSWLHGQFYRQHARLFVGIFAVGFMGSFLGGFSGCYVGSSVSGFTGSFVGSLRAVSQADVWPVSQADVWPVSRLFHMQFHVQFWVNFINVNEPSAKVVLPDRQASWGQSYKTFYVRNLRILVIS